MFRDLLEGFELVDDWEEDMQEASPTFCIVPREVLPCLTETFNEVDHARDLDHDWCKITSEDTGRGSEICGQESPGVEFLANCTETSPTADDKTTTGKELLNSLIVHEKIKEIMAKQHRAKVQAGTHTHEQNNDGNRDEVRVGATGEGVDLKQTDALILAGYRFQATRDLWSTSISSKEQATSAQPVKLGGRTPRIFLSDSSSATACEVVLRQAKPAGDQPAPTEATLSSTSMTVEFLAEEEARRSWSGNVNSPACRFDPSHKVPLRKLQEHERKCICNPANLNGARKSTAAF
mmetsp:Transcript_66921/g.100909  ORF Transcript_66921/g.100909 Transcript_66921/m.100909 type:complete len:293 (+) Transcript_66921:80-958(+)